MPILDGIETTIKINELVKQKVLKKIPIIALTANTEESNLKRCMQVGMVDMIGKPLKKDTLLDALKKHCSENSCSL